MDQDAIIHELIGLQDKMMATSPEEALIKRASDQDWSTAILEKAAQVYNAARTMDHFSKSASRESDFPIIDPQALTQRFVTYEEPAAPVLTKAASATHNADVDLTREMSKAANINVIPEIPEEHRVDESILDKQASAEIEDPYDGMGRPQYIQRLHNEAQIAQGAYNAAAAEYLKDLDKSAHYMNSELDISNDEHVARHQCDAHVVDWVVDSLAKHANVMHKSIRVHSGGLRKMAFANTLTSPIIGLADLYASAVAITKYACFIEEGMDPTEALEKAAAEVKDEEKVDLDTKRGKGGMKTNGEDTDKGKPGEPSKNEEKPKPKPKKDDDDLLGGTARGSGDGSVKTNGEETKKPGEPTKDKDVLEGVERGSGRTHTSGQETDTETPGEPVTPTPANFIVGDSSGDPLLRAGDYDKAKGILKDVGSVGSSIYGAGRGIGDGAATALADVMESARDGEGVHPGQEEVDSAVSDTRRAIDVRRLIARDPVLRETDPKTVLNMYNMLAQAKPELAGNLDAMAIPLREAVSYGGIPAENLKTISSIGSPRLA